MNIVYHYKEPAMTKKEVCNPQKIADFSFILQYN